MNDESPFAPALIQDDQDQRASMTTGAPDDVFAMKNEAPPVFGWKPRVQDDLDRQARLAASAANDALAMKNGTSAFDQAPLIQDDMHQRACMAASALDLSYRYVNADEAATARRVARQIGVPYGVALRNPVEAQQIRQRQVFGQFADAHPEHIDWIVDNSDFIHDDVEAIDAVIASTKKIQLFLTNEVAPFFNDEIAPFLTSEDFKDIIAFAGPFPGASNLNRSLMQGFVGGFLGRTMRGAFGETIDIGIRKMASAFDLPDSYDITDVSNEYAPIAGAEIALKAMWNEARGMERSGNNPFILAGQGLEEIGAFIGPEDQESFIHQVLYGIGMGAPTIAAMVLSGGGAAIPALIGFGQGSAYMSDDARQHEAYGTPEGDEAVLRGGALGGVANALTFTAIMAPALERIARVVGPFAARLLAGSVVGGAISGAEQLGDNVLARSFYDPERDIWQDVGHRTMLGAAVGTTLSAGVGVYHAGVAKRGGPLTARDADSIATLVEKNGEAFAAKHTGDSISRLMDVVETSKAAARAPGEIAGVIGRILGDKNARITLSGDALFDLYARPKLARELGLSSKDIVDAHLKGEGIPVDLGRLVVSEQARGMRNVLLPHIQKDGKAMTQAEAVRWNETGRDAFVQEQLSRAQEEGTAQENPAIHPEAQKPSAEQTTSILKVAEQAEPQMFQKVLGELRQQRIAEWKEKSDVLTQEIRAEIVKEPVNLALEWLLFNRNKAGEEKGSLKIKTQDIIDLKGGAFLEKLPGKEENGQRKIIGPVPYAEDGMPAKHVASRFGFSSAERMLTAIAEARSPEIIVKERVAQEMAHHHGDEINEASLERKANEAVRNYRRSEVLALELEALGQKPEQTSARISQIQALAKETVGDMPVWAVRHSSRFAHQERMAADAFKNALAKGDIQAAIEAKKQQILAFSMIKESERVRVEANSILHTLWKSAKETRTDMDAHYWEPIAMLLEQYGFKPSGNQKAGQWTSLREWQDATRARDVEVAIPETLLATEGRPLNHNIISINHLRDVNRGIQNIALGWLEGENPRRVTETLKLMEDLGVEEIKFPTEEAKVKTERQLEERLAHEREWFHAMADRIADDPKGTRNEKVELWHGHLNEDQVHIVNAALKDPANEGHGFITKDFDIEFAIRSFDDESIRHALKGHSNDAIPLKPEDFQHIPDVLEKGEFVKTTLERDRGPFKKLVLVWRKEVDGKWLYVGERLRTGDTPTLTFATAYWNPKAKDKGGVSAALQ